uniref:Uncharacterized protein n=1 Tax=Tetranychus urticae TaxID=32264 RepID=T1KC16_TETUR
MNSLPKIVKNSVLTNSRPTTVIVTIS